MKKRKCLLITKTQAWPFSFLNNSTEKYFWETLFTNSVLSLVFYKKKSGRVPNHMCTILGNSAKKEIFRVLAMKTRKYSWDPFFTSPVLSLLCYEKMVRKSQHLCAIFDNADKDIQEIFDDLATGYKKIFINVELHKNFQAMFAIYAIKLRECSVITKIQAWPFSFLKYSLFHQFIVITVVLWKNSQEKSTFVHLLILRWIQENIHQCWIT